MYIEMPELVLGTWSIHQMDATDYRNNPYKTESQTLHILLY